MIKLSVATSSCVYHPDEVEMLDEGQEMRLTMPDGRVIHLRVEDVKSMARRRTEVIKLIPVKMSEVADLPDWLADRAEHAQVVPL